MSSFNLILSDFVILGFGGLFCLTWAFGLALSIPGRIKIIAVYFVGISGFRLSWEGFTLSGLATVYPEYYAFPIPFLYLIAPSILLYYERLGGSDRWNLSFYHFIPFLFGFVPLLFWYKMSVDEQSIAVINILKGNWTLPYNYFILWVIGPKISILIYSIYISFRKSGEGVLVIKLLPEKIRFFSISLLIYILIMILTDIAGYILGERVLYQWSARSHTFAAICVYLYSRLNPLATFEISSAIKTARYSQSKLVSVNTEEAVHKLNHLMESESFYADEDLRLSTLAEAMNISSHQLSELINVKFNMNFINFVNSHRIKIACKMLEEESRNILSIAFAVGFNSKSAFNRVFKQCIGTSPREFRKNPKLHSKAKSLLEEKINPKL